MGKEGKQMEKRFKELLSLISKEDRPKALKLLWEIFYIPGKRPPPSAELFTALDIIAEEMKKLNIPIYLP